MNESTNQRMNGFTLAEIMVVMAIFSVLLGAVFTILVNSNRAWHTGQDKLAEQQEARRVVNDISRLIRQSSPSWTISGTSYPVAVSDLNRRIDFYEPTFDGAGDIVSLEKITYKLNPADSRQLLKKEGGAVEKVIANNIEALTFGGGCAGCATYTCASVASDCPAVNINITTNAGVQFNLVSQVFLRNPVTALDAGTQVDEPAEGEF